MTEKDILDLADEAILHINRGKGFDATLAEMLFHKGVDEKKIREIFTKVHDVAKQKRPDLFENDRKAWRSEYNVRKD